MTSVAAVDLGATSGRVVVADLDGDVIRLAEVARFPNGPREVAGRWVWDAPLLHAQVMDGLAVAAQQGVRSCGIDTWGVDYGVLRDGAADGPVYAYRDPWHEQGVARVEALLPRDALYRHTGTQHLAINTVFQLAADDRIGPGATVLMTPDLLSYWATGVVGTDVTIASTSGLVDPRSRQWSGPVLSALGLPADAFVPTQEPGCARGACRDPRLGGLPLIGVGSHDTASAFAGTPLRDRDRALVLSLGTWALIGAEVRDAVAGDAVPSDAARVLNVTHELGVDGTVRLLGNVCGMWLLEECRRAWAREDGREPAIADLIRAAEEAPAFEAVFDIDAPALSAPGQGPHTIAPHLVGAWSGTRGSIVRTILASLVVRVAERAREIEALLGGDRPTLHVVGGASRIATLMQWLADATGRTVVAGPIEATAMGNAIVQWRALDAVGSIAEARMIVAGLPEIRRYEPTGDRSVWDAYAARLHG